MMRSRSSVAIWPRARYAERPAEKVQQLGADCASTADEVLVHLVACARYRPRRRPERCRALGRLADEFFTRAHDRHSNWAFPRRRFAVAPFEAGRIPSGRRTSWTCGPLRAISMTAVCCGALGDATSSVSRLLAKDGIRDAIPR